MHASEMLIKKLNDRTATVCIVGMGYVGLPLALRLAEVGFKVLGLDVDADRVAKLNRGESFILHIPTAEVKEAVARGFRASTDFAESKKCEAIIICVPTPLNRYREPDLSYVTGSMDSLVPHLRAGQVISLESTTYPGTTDEEIVPRVEKAGFKPGQDVFVVYSPEREDPGNARFKTKTIPKVVGGLTPACLEVGKALYSAIIDQVVPVGSLKAAEMTKLLENIHRSVNIGLVNEMKIVADRMGIDIHEVIRAASTKPFGFTPYFPGPGLGGHCIPIDPFYLTWKAREYGIHTRFIELSGEINSSMPRYVVDKTQLALNRAGKAVKGAKVLILGLSYKKNVDDVRESPAAEIVEFLHELGADLSVCDPLVERYRHPKMGFEGFRQVAFEDKALEAADAVVIVTDHQVFDWARVAAKSKLIVDSRGVYTQAKPNVVKA